MKKTLPLLRLAFSLFMLSSINGAFAQNCQNDVIPPSVNLNTADTIYHGLSTSYFPVSVTATDNCSSENNISVTKTSNVNPFIPGCYSDTYTATDHSGNITTKVRTVCVKDYASIGETSNNVNFKVSPNPTNGSIQIGLNPSDEVKLIKVFNLLGEQVLLKQVNGLAVVNLTIDGPQGLYFVQAVTDSKNSSMLKVIKH